MSGPIAVVLCIAALLLEVFGTLVSLVDYHGNFTAAWIVQCIVTGLLALAFVVSHMTIEWRK